MNYSGDPKTGRFEGRFNHSKTGQNGQVFECLAKTGHFRPVFKWFCIRKPEHLQSNLILIIRKPDMSGFRIPTVYGNIIEYDFFGTMCVSVLTPCFFNLSR